MKISTSTYGILQPYGLKEGLKAIANAGFEAIDYSITQNAMDWEEGFFQDISLPDFAQHFKKIGKTVRDTGLEMGQCHAPYASPTFSDLAFYANLQKQIIRSIYAAGYMETPYIVAHPVLDIAFCEGQNREVALQTTLDHFSAMAPALKETGVTMCIENLFFFVREGNRWLPNFGSNAEDLCEVIDTLNAMHGPYFAACVDTGHAVAARNDPAELLRGLGSRTKVLHIQDTLPNKDAHLIPTFGSINWKEVTTALGEVGYRGTFNFEVSKPFSNLTPDIYSREAFTHACNLLYAIGRALIDLTESAAK